MARSKKNTIYLQDIHLNQYTDLITAIKSMYGLKKTK